MNSQPRVHIVSVDAPGIPTHHSTAHYKSLENEPLISYSTVSLSNHSYGGTFLRVMEEWAKSKAEYVGYLPTSFVLPKDRIAFQTNIMDKYSLSGSYGDMVQIDDKGQDLVIENYRSFSTDMLGFDAIPTETMLIRRPSFANVGGFDHVISGSCKPSIYLVTMTAVAGKIKKIELICAKRYNERVSGTRGDALLTWDNPAVDHTWSRFRLDKFISQARAYYKDMGWV